MPRIIVDTCEYGDPAIQARSERVKRLIQFEARRRSLRAIREAAVAARPSWLREIDWPFPTWRVRSRPFDHRIDA